MIQRWTTPGSQAIESSASRWSNDSWDDGRVNSTAETAQAKPPQKWGQPGVPSHQHHLNQPRRDAAEVPKRSQASGGRPAGAGVTASEWDDPSAAAMTRVQNQGGPASPATGWKQTASPSSPANVWKQTAPPSSSATGWKQGAASSSNANGWNQGTAAAGAASNPESIWTSGEDWESQETSTSGWITQSDGWPAASAATKAADPSLKDGRKIYDEWMAESSKVQNGGLTAGSWIIRRRKMVLWFITLLWGRGSTRVI